MLAQLWDQCYLFVDGCACGTGTPKERAMTSRWVVVSALRSCLHWPVSGPRPSLCVQTDRQGRLYDITNTALWSEGKATAAMQYYNYGICVQTERQGRLYNITTVASVFRLKDDEGYAIVKPSVSFTNVWLCAPVDGKNIRVSASVSVRMANKHMISRFCLSGSQK